MGSKYLQLLKGKNIKNSNIVLENITPSSLFNVNLVNPNEIYLFGTNNVFINTHIDQLLKAHTLYFDNSITDCEVLIKIQKKLLSNNNFSIYMNENKYDKFTSYLETISQYKNGVTFDNSKQVKPIDLSNLKYHIDTCNKENIIVE